MQTEYRYSAYFSANRQLGLGLLVYYYLNRTLVRGLLLRKQIIGPRPPFLLTGLTLVLGLLFRKQSIGTRPTIP